MRKHKNQQCIHDAHEFGTFDNVTGVCWVCGKALVVEHRYATSMVANLQEEGFTVS